MDSRNSPNAPPNSSPKLAWGSPARAAAPPSLRPMATFPPMNVRTPPYMGPPPPGYAGPPIPGMPRFGTFDPSMGNSPHFLRHPPPGSFRTPQPHARSYSPNNARSPWSDNRGNQRRQRFPANQSPHGSPHNSPRPNQSNNPIERYYKPSMVQDPWANLPVPPSPVY